MGTDEMLVTIPELSEDELDAIVEEWVRSLATDLRNALDEGRADFADRGETRWQCREIARVLGGLADRETTTLLSLLRDPKGIRSYRTVLDALDSFGVRMVQRIEARRAERARVAARRHIREEDLPF